MIKVEITPQVEKKLKKQITRTLDRYGVFNERPFIKDEYRQKIVRDIINIYIDL